MIVQCFWHMHACLILLPQVFFFFVFVSFPAADLQISVGGQQGKWKPCPAAVHQPEDRTAQK